MTLEIFVWIVLGAAWIGAMLLVWAICKAGKVPNK